MIFFNIGCGILIFSNFMISLIPNKNAINPKYFINTCVCIRNYWSRRTSDAAHAFKK